MCSCSMCVRAYTAATVYVYTNMHACAYLIMHKCTGKILKNYDYAHACTVIDKPPKIINKPSNVTIAVGLPITFRCSVEGDPTHYWVGWMVRNAVIQKREEYSIAILLQIFNQLMVQTIILQ